MSDANDYHAMSKEGDPESPRTTEKPEEVVQAEDTILKGKELAVVFLAMYVPWMLSQFMGISKGINV